MRLNHSEVTFFFFNDTATTEIYTLSLHDALPILPASCRIWSREPRLPESNIMNTGLNPPLDRCMVFTMASAMSLFACVQASDRKSTRLNSSHSQISYAVFCLKKKQCAHRGLPS